MYLCECQVGSCRGSSSGEPECVEGEVGRRQWGLEQRPAVWLSTDGVVTQRGARGQFWGRTAPRTFFAFLLHRRHQNQKMHALHYRVASLRVRRFTDHHCQLYRPRTRRASARRGQDYLSTKIGTSIHKKSSLQHGEILREYL